MSEASGDNSGAAGRPTENASSAAKTLIMRGNRIDSRDLFAAEREIIIAHGEENYRLRLTSQNKLILTK
ncbi:hemin uptake protein HemP [Bradyrhizobium sp. ORS 86]|uniref:hemin uptake protein HemP n=1 Tax=Bradyrhizobium sp. ORS 86 TaxID=1685970 RepID=UPI00388F3119